MKIIYIDTAIDGHHLTYLSALIKGADNDHVLILPEKVESRGVKQYVCTDKDSSEQRTFQSYCNWMKQIKAIVKKEKPDVVHFLYGDVFYRYFGYGLGALKGIKTIITLHWARTGILQKISTKMICSQVDVAVVHSSYIKTLISGYGANNVVHIEYPQFNTNMVTKEDACGYWGISTEIPTIACIGHTRQDKGLDILLEALDQVDKPFQLLVAGKEDSFDRTFIEEKILKYQDRVRLCLKYLTDEELANALGAADIIALPYRKTFNGASGPLGEGVALNKCIVGSNHGNLGDTIEKNHLGYTFESENSSALAEILNRALIDKFKPDNVYIRYQESLNVDAFIESYHSLYHIN